MEQSPQIFAIPTYDAAFKYILSDTEICASFLKAFIPDHKVEQVQLLDTYLNSYGEKKDAFVVLTGLAEHYAELQQAFLQPQCNSQVDIICKVDDYLAIASVATELLG